MTTSYIYRKKKNTFLFHFIDTYIHSWKVLKSSTWVPKTRYANWAYARKMMKNIMVKPKRSLAHLDMVVESWLMVLLKLMNLKSCRRGTLSLGESMIQCALHIQGNYSTIKVNAIVTCYYVNFESMLSEISRCKTSSVVCMPPSIWNTSKSQLTGTGKTMENWQVRL